MRAAAWWSGSLRRRLLLAAGLWITLALLVVGLLLVALFRHHVEQELAARAAGPLDALAAALMVDAPSAGAPPEALPGLRLSEEPDEDAFREAFSGAYWWVMDGDVTALRSRSWWDVHPPKALVKGFERLTGADIDRFQASGPRDQPLVVWARRVELAAWDRPLVVAVGLDASRLEGMTRRYAHTVAWALGALALALWGASWWQVRMGLVPLARLQQALGALRSGHEARLQGRHPDEVQPLVDELHALLSDNDRLVAQAREQTANLAHALKTPLAVLGNLATPAQHGLSAEADAWRQQLGLIQRQVDLHLARARATSAGRHTSRAQARYSDLGEVIDGLLRTLDRLHAARGIHARRPGGRMPARVAIDTDVLHEVLGNVLDNAYQWAGHQVQVSWQIKTRDAEDARACWELLIDDDGPGIPPARRDEALQRGGRLDQTRPGSGLGLAIAAELVTLAQGTLALDSAPLGGLRVTISLPGVPGSV